MRSVRHVVLASIVVVAAVTALSGAAGEVCDDCLKARYWTVPPFDEHAERSPAFPESAMVASRPDLGIAFSGGGTRSAAATLGQLRALHHLGWLSSVRYVSAVSGGAWAAVPFTYSTLLPDDLLGRIEQEDPSRFTLERVRNEPNGALANAIAGSSLAAGGVREAAAFLANRPTNEEASALRQNIRLLARRLRRGSERNDKMFSRLLGELFIDPLVQPTGEKASGRLFSWDAATLAEMMRVNAGRLPADILLPRGDRPFLIAQGTIVAARRDYGYPLLMPVEYTPLYVGTRQRFGGRFGGSYVWPWAYDTTTVGRREDGYVQVRYEPARTFTLADVIASTGAAPQLWLMLSQDVPKALSDATRTFAGFFPSFRHLALQDDAGVEPVAEVPGTPHADGGLLDNLAIMPLLARQVKNILVFDNAGSPNFDSSSELRSLFFPAGTPGGSGDKTRNRVFKEENYARLMAGLTDAWKARKPLVWCDTNWEVVPNAHHHIHGYSGLNICWFYNAGAAAWEETLPDDIRKLVTGVERKRNAGRFDTFPWYETFYQNKPHVMQLTRAQVNLLANLTAWTVMRPETRQMIDTTLSVRLPPPAR